MTRRNPDNRGTYVDLPYDLLLRVKNEAAEKEITMRQVIINALEDWFYKKRIKE